MVSSHRSIPSATLYLFVQGVLEKVIGFIYVVFAANILSVAEIGITSALSMILPLFITFGTLAIPGAAVKYISEFMGKRKPNVAKRIYKQVLKFGLLVSILSSLLCFVASNVISIVVLGSQIYQPLIWLLALDIFALLLLTFCAAILAGLQKFREISLISVIFVGLKYTFSIYLVVKGFGLMGIMAGWVAGDMIGLAMLFVFVSISFKTTQDLEPYPFKQLIGYSMPLYASGALNYFAGTVERYIMLFFAGLQTLAIYSVAMTVGGITMIVSGSLGGPLLPWYSKLYGQHGREALNEGSSTASRYIFLIYVPLTIGLATTAYPMIALFYGARYTSGWLAITIVSVTSAMTCATLVFNNLLLSLGDTRPFLVANTLAIGLGLPSSVLLVTLFGESGAALAKSFVTITLFAYPAYVVKKSLGLHLDLDAFKKSWISSAVMALIIVPIQLLWMDIYMLPLYILIGGFTYFLMLRLLNALKYRDIEIARQLIPKRFTKIVDAFAMIYSVKPPRD